MKTTREIADPIFRRAKARAGEEGISLRQFVTEAVAEKLGTTAAAQKKVSLRLVGGLRHLRKETARINQRIEEEFESRTL